MNTLELIDRILSCTYTLKLSDNVKYNSSIISGISCMRREQRVTYPKNMRSNDFISSVERCGGIAEVHVIFDIIHQDINASILYDYLMRLCAGATALVEFIHLRGEGRFRIYPHSKKNKADFENALPHMMIKYITIEYDKEFFQLGG